MRRRRSTTAAEALGAEGAGGFESGRVEADGTAATPNSDVVGNDADSSP